MSPAPTEPQFDRDGWWDPGCRAFASLRAVTTFRLELLRRWLPAGFAGRRIVDLGCGGGLLAAPLAAAGARVVGVDVARQALRDARRHAGAGMLPVVGDLLAPPVPAGVADLVLLADVLEHVDAQAAAMHAAARLLRPGGALFVNTIARTLRARLLAITLGEGLGLIPRGTHQWRRFVRPRELDAMAAAAGLVPVHRTGEAPRLLATLRRGAVVLRASRGLGVGYAVLYRREVA